MVEIRAEERRAVLGGFLTLLCVMCGHALVETARDALFLASIPPQRLPLVYLAIAGLALLVNRGYERVMRRFCHRSFLFTNLLLVTASALAFWWLIGLGDTIWIYALYVWSGVATMLVVVRLWTSLADRFTPTQAKRLFVPIGAGSVSGAILGSAIARFLTAGGETRPLLLAAAAAYFVGALVAAGSTQPRADDAEEVEAESAPRSDLRAILRQPYIVRLLVWVVVATATFAVADFLFKWVVAQRVAPERLGSFFANCYLVFHLLSLLLQVTLVTWLVRSLGLHRVVGLPALLLALAGMATLGLALAAPAALLAGAIAIKGVDGALRHSMHRTATEILYVPLSREVRNRSKALLDVAGQRGGQAFGSLLILALVATPWPTQSLLILLLALCAGWIGLAYSLRSHYLDLFRHTLDQRSFETSIEFPSLDLASLESLIETLNSSEDGRVLAALELLAEQERTRLIPVLILYHPSTDIVVRALDLFAAVERRDVLPVTRRLLTHGEPRIRAAALRTLNVIDQEGDLPIAQFLDDESPTVRATALITLIASDWMEPQEATHALNAFANSADVEERLALAEAIAQRPLLIFLPTLERLSQDADEEIGSATARALSKLGDPAGLTILLPMLAQRRLRGPARDAILALRPSVVPQLAAALADPDTPIDIRRHLPRTMMRFAPEEVSHPLLTQLTQVHDGVLRYKIIRALETLRSRVPSLALDRRELERAIERTLGGTFRLVDWQLQLERGMRDMPYPPSPVAELLAQTLRHKRRHAIERLFRLLGLLYPGEDFRRMHEGLRSLSPKRRSSSLELLEATLRSPLRESVLALVDDRPDQSRVLAGSAHHEPIRGDYSDLLRALLAEGGMALQSLAAYQIGELRISALREDLAALSESANPYVRVVVQRSLARVDGRRRGVVHE